MFSTQRGESVRLIGCTEQGCSSQCPRVNVHDMWLKLFLLFMEIEMKSISFVFLHRKTHCGHRAAKQRDREIWSRIIWLMLRAPHNLAVFSEDAHTLTHMAALSIYSPSCLISWNQIKRSRLVHVTDIVGATAAFITGDWSKPLYSCEGQMCLFFGLFLLMRERKFRVMKIIFDGVSVVLMKAILLLFVLSSVHLFKSALVRLRLWHHSSLRSATKREVYHCGYLKGLYVTFCIDSYV